MSDRETCQSWMHRAAPTNNTQMAMLNGLLVFETSIDDAELLEVCPVSQPPLGNLPIADCLWSQPRSDLRAKHQIVVNPQQSAIENSNIPAITVPTIQAPESPKLPQKARNLQKRLPSCTRASTSGPTSLDTSSRQHRSPAGKLGHRMVERRYRINLNEKIALLRDCIPSLKITDKRASNCATNMPGNLCGPEDKPNLKKVSQVTVFSPSPAAF
jgi:hypothetical protein